MEEGADMAMKELLEDEDKAAAAVSPQKKKKKAKTGKERRQGSEEQKDSERTEAGSPKKQTKNVAKIQVEAGHGHTSVTELLIAARCNVDLKNEGGSVPLHVAAHEGKEAVTKQLLAVRCNVHLQSKDGQTALQVAQRKGHTGIAALIRNRMQETPLLGRCVIINGLVAKPELNGRTGTAVSFDDDTARYSVELDETSTLMIKPCNLSLQVFSVVWLCLACFYKRIHYQGFL